MRISTFKKTASVDIKNLATELGFDVCRITRVDDAWAAAQHLDAFVAAGHHGEMTWMEETRERRRHPRAMWDGARSAVVVGMNYGPRQDPMAGLAHKDRAVISCYAQGKDYHDLLKKRLKQLARTFSEETGAEVKVFVDTAPLMEKPLAEAAGLGWQGKHTNLVSQDLGSWLFLGVMLTSAQLEPDASGGDHCGSCRACLDICPTDAFPAPYKLDARRCISYLTIEHKGPIPEQFRAAMGNRIYGCDDCLAVCPWNKFAQAASEAAFHARAELKQPRLADLAQLDDADFRTVFSGSPIKRIGRDRFVRNVLVAIGNSGDDALVSYAADLLSDDAAIVRGAAIWAVSRLDPDRFTLEYAKRYSEEADASVRGEWEQGRERSVSL